MTSRPVVRFLDRTTPPHIVTLILMAGVAAMNMSVILPSLPAMTRHFGTEYAVMQLAVSGYLAMTAVLQLMIGPISDRFGRRSISLIATAIFVVATLVSMAAPDVTAFLALRLVSGAVVATMVLSRAIIRDMVSTDESASMIGYVTMGMALVPMIAPMIGGALDEAFGWEAVYLFLAASGLGVGLLMYFDLGETSQGAGRSFRDQMREYPELLRSPRFWGYVLAAAFASGSFFAFLGGAPYVATEVYGLSAFWAGMGFGAPASGYMLGNALSGRFATRVGIDALIQIGAVMATAGLLVSTLVSAMGLGSAVAFFAFCSFMGLGNGLVMPNATAGLLSVRPSLAGSASGLGGAIMIAGGAALSAGAGALLEGGQSDLPLLVMMTVSALLSVVSIRFVVARRKKLAMQG